MTRKTASSSNQGVRIVQPALTATDFFLFNYLKNKSKQPNKKPEHFVNKTTLAHYPKLYKIHEKCNNKGLNMTSRSRCQSLSKLRKVQRDVMLVRLKIYKRKKLFLLQN